MNSITNVYRRVVPESVFLSLSSDPLRGSANLFVGKDIVFRFIKEYSSLMDFGPYVIGLFWYEDFWKVIFWLVLKLEISCRVMVSWRVFGFFWRIFFEDYVFAWWNIWIFIILLLP